MQALYREHNGLRPLGPNTHNGKGAVSNATR